jgi:hypothetical protein
MSSPRFQRGPSTTRRDHATASEQEPESPLKRKKARTPKWSRATTGQGFRSFVLCRFSHHSVFRRALAVVAPDRDTAGRNVADVPKDSARALNGLGSRTHRNPATPTYGGTDLNGTGQHIDFCLERQACYRHAAPHNDENPADPFRSRGTFGHCSRKVTSPCGLIQQWQHRTARISRPNLAIRRPAYWSL